MLCGLLWRYNGLALAVIPTEASLAQENYSSSHVLLTPAVLEQEKGQAVLGGVAVSQCMTLKGHHRPSSPCPSPPKMLEEVPPVWCSCCVMMGVCSEASTD